MFTSSFMACMTDPAPRNRPALKKPWVSRCMIANAYPAGPKPGGQHHVADLAHRARRERFLDVVLGAADDRPEQQRHRADDDHTQLRVGRKVEDRTGPHDQVHARGDHGGGVDERRHRCGALHRVAEPGLQRHLRRLAARGQQQQQPDRGQRAFTEPGCGREDTRRTRSSRCRRTSPSARSPGPCRRRG